LGKKERDRGESQENQENSPKKVFEVEESVWEGEVGKDAN